MFGAEAIKAEQSSAGLLSAADAFFIMFAAEDCLNDQGQHGASYFSLPRLPLHPHPVLRIQVAKDK